VFKLLHKCILNFDDASSAQMCKDYSALSYERQKDMLLHVVKRCEVVRKRERTGEGRGKNWSSSYFFIKNDAEIRVCKNFFLRTLCVSNGPVNTEKSELTGGFIGNDKRIKKNTSERNKT
jgi:hypothetical protein